jgi:DNA-binding FadR family transcriptional regulator
LLSAKKSECEIKTSRRKRPGKNSAGAGKIQPGDCLAWQRDLARVFRVGLGTVREALTILAVMGCLKILHGDGSYVSKPASAVLNGAPCIENVLEALSLAELMTTREGVETVAARMAAENADSENIHALRRITSGMLSADISSETDCKTDFNYYRQRRRYGRGCVTGHPVGVRLHEPEMQRRFTPDHP